MDDLLTIGQRSRTADPATSHEAGAAAEKFLGAHHEAILNVMLEARRPMAAQEISDVLGWKSHHAVNRRLPEPRDRNLIVRTTLRYINASGRGAFQYKLVDNG